MWEQYSRGSYLLNIKDVKISGRKSFSSLNEASKVLGCVHGHRMDILKFFLGNIQEMR